MNACIQLSRKKVAENPGARWEGLNGFLAFTDLRSLSPVQRIAALAYNYSSAIVMSGHREYFSTASSADYAELVAALRAVGAIEQAGVLTDALEAVRAAGARAPDKYADRFVAGVEFADLARFDEAFECCQRPVSDCLLDYLDRHEAEFVEWKP